MNDPSAAANVLATAVNKLFGERYWLAKCDLDDARPENAVSRGNHEGFHVVSRTGRAMPNARPHERRGHAHHYVDGKRAAAILHSARGQSQIFEGACTNAVSQVDLGGISRFDGRLTPERPACRRWDPGGCNSIDVQAKGTEMARLLKNGENAGQSSG
jgi:hypothetical protein